MLPLVLLIACGGSSEEPTEVPEAPTGTETAMPTAETGTPPSTGATGDTGDTGDTGPVVDCAKIPAPPLAVTRLTGPPASEDFAFDDQGHVISHQGLLLLKSEYPPGAVTPWASTQGGPGGPASMRMLSTGDLVYHDVDTATLYRVDPGGGATVVFSGFGYAGGIEVHPTDLVYVVDLTGLHLVDPYTFDHRLMLQSAPWISANGVSLSEDYATLYVSASDGIWSVPVDAAGTPTGPPTVWAPPPGGAQELLGMGVDACGNVYVTGSALGTSTLWRYPSGGGAPEVLLERPGGWLSNLQWGSGIGGWEQDVLYVVDRNQGYDALEVQVPSKPR